MKYMLKLVPDAVPNTEGRWLEVETIGAPLLGSGWCEASKFLEPYVPAGEHLVGYKQV